MRIYFGYEVLASPQRLFRYQRNLVRRYRTSSVYLYKTRRAYFGRHWFLCSWGTTRALGRSENG